MHECTTALYSFANRYLISFMVTTRCGWKPAIDPPIGQHWNPKSFPFPVLVRRIKYLSSGEDRTVWDNLLPLQMSWETMMKKSACGILRAAQASSEISSEGDKNHMLL